ncbi:ABC transporter substrate-binding protein [Prevotella dentasini]
MTHRTSILYLLLLLLLYSCGQRRTTFSKAETETPITFKYARNIRIESEGEALKVSLTDPWNKGKTLHTYYLLPATAKAPGHTGQGTIVRIPLRRGVFFTTAHANLLEMLHAQSSIAGVGDARYMLIPDVQHRLRDARVRHPIADCGGSMAPNIERIIDLRPDGIFLSPFENSGGYGKLDELDIPIIECADYMETSALGRAEWMKFYGLLFGCERQADSLFAVVEREYNGLKAKAARLKTGRMVLPDRKTGAVWYMPGGKSSVGLLYKDANGSYAFSDDNHSGSLALPFETVLDKEGQSDFWILTYNGKMSRKILLAEYQGYSMLPPMKTGEVYGCPADKVPYFEEVSWRPDWLLNDLIQLFHPDMRTAPLRYYHKLL